MKRFVDSMESFIFWSRWLQAPLYIGLIAAQGVYVYQFFIELWHLVHDASQANEIKTMLTVLGLVDVVMVSNLLIMVIIGGYETFVSRLELISNHPDRPDWLSHVDAGVLKVKLSMALIGISSVHLLRSFISMGSATSNASSTVDYNNLQWQVIIHVVFLISAIAMAWVDRIVSNKSKH
ncbi:TIGR00645 family protein [Parachitinimonas caeni]|uniref:UPF0114 protein PZA18_02675 n=1 Tax=Parachitinimonas caeni TaxID=3031301 RepID=A0ABT7DWC0_9NEIS|nr:TIGR00645 family protein [Parachitinimonas caeni]MDK2122952.1 TIGR00645 family protein [Parachitinimonas caeni]